MPEKPAAPVANLPPEQVAPPSPAPAKAGKDDGASNNLVTKSVAIGIGSAAIVAALMYIRRR